MNLEHPLWKGHTLQLQSEFKDELDMMSEVRKWVEATQDLPDLTTAEKSFLRMLEQWLTERNAEYE